MWAEGFGFIRCGLRVFGFRVLERERETERERDGFIGYLGSEKQGRHPRVHDPGFSNAVELMDLVPAIGLSLLNLHRSFLEYLTLPCSLPPVQLYPADWRAVGFHTGLRLLGRLLRDEAQSALRLARV